MKTDFLDFFAGIGLFRLGLEQAGWTCRGHCEIDTYAEKSYKAMHDVKESEWFEKDITKVNSKNLPDVTLWVGGFPCQDCSIAGNRQGLFGSRSGLFFEVIRLLQERDIDHRPRWLILENVKGILSSNNTTDFGIVLYELATLGYGVEYALLNSKNFGVPQNRERVYIICDITSRSTGKIFPFGRKNTAALKQIVGGSQGSRVYTTKGITPTITSRSGGLGAKTGLYLVDLSKNNPQITDNARCLQARYNKGVSNRSGEVSGVLKVQACLTPDRLNKRQNGRRIKNEEEEMFALTAQDRHGIVQGSRIRRLTPRETFRLQGVPDEYFDKAEKVCSDAQLYRQSGNAVTVPVVKAIGEKIKEFIRQEKENCND